MKQRITISIDPRVSVRAKQLAHSKKTSVSGLVEQFFRGVPLSTREEKGSFVRRWAGTFSVASTKSADKRMRVLKKRFNLT